MSGNSGGIARPVPLLILGLGNVLCGDDGLGVVAVHRLLRHYEAPLGVRVLDGGTLGLALLPYLEDAQEAILVDAVRTDSQPGAHVRLEGDEVLPAVSARLSPHQVGVADLLDGARWRERYPARVLLLGLVPETLALGVGLSSPVELALPVLVERIAEEARRLGRAFSPKREAEATPGWSPSDLADARSL